MRRTAATSLLALVLMAGEHAAAQTPTIINLSCDGTVLPALSTGKEEGDPVKKMGMVVNLAERTVTISGVSVTTPIDRADAASISFNATEVPYSFSAGGLRGTGTMTVWGQLDRVTGAAYVSTTTTIIKDKASTQSYDLVCKVTNRLF
jgi:hypothetical protein